MAVETFNMQNILQNKKTKIPNWEYVTRIKKKNEIIEIPKKVWQNLKVILDEHDIKVSYNKVTKGIEFSSRTFAFSEENNGKLTDINSLQLIDGLNMQRSEVVNSLTRIAEISAYNPFLEMLRQNRNNSYNLIDKVFNTIPIKKSFMQYEDFFRTLFKKWLFNVMVVNHNTVKSQKRSEGVFIIQGEQGGRKSTFFSKLMPPETSDLFKGDISLNPDKVDSIIANTKYSIVEWGELDSTLKAEQSKLKQFITTLTDEYRSPYAYASEVHPRLTSFCGSVNKLGFLKDETGSRRFWVVPMEDGCKIDIEALSSIDMKKFWGAVYDMWISEEENGYHVVTQHWLPQEEEKLLAHINRSFDSENDISITLDEYLDWDSDIMTWQVYNAGEICNAFNLQQSKVRLKNEMQRRDIPYKVYKVRGKCKRGYKIPKIDELNYINYSSEY